MIYRVGSWCGALGGLPLGFRPSRLVERLSPEVHPRTIERALRLGERAKGRHSSRESTPGALTAHYEALCQAALGQASSAGHGMALFVQGGMAACLTAWTELDRCYPVFAGHHRPCAAHQQP